MSVCSPRWTARVKSAQRLWIVACAILCSVINGALTARADLASASCSLAPHASPLLEFNLAADATWERRHVHAVQEARTILEAIEGPIVVLSVAGPLGSGKSFLANQLLPFAAPEDAFEVTRASQQQQQQEAGTQAVSMYVLPPCVMSADTALRDTSLIVVDSPGLFRRDRSPAFDAQVLSVLHLLSSTLMWVSSSPGIDQAQLLALDVALEEGVMLGALTKPHLMWTITPHTAPSNAAADPPLSIDADYFDRMANLSDSGSALSASSATPQIRSHFRRDFQRFFASTTTVALPPPLAPATPASGTAIAPTEASDPSAPGAHLSAEYRVARDALKAALWRSFELQQDRPEPDPVPAPLRRRRRKKAPQAKQLQDGTPINGRLLSAVVGAWAEQLTNSTAPIRAGPAFISLVISREAERMRDAYRSAMPLPASLPLAASILVASHRTARAQALKGYVITTQPDPSVLALRPSAPWLLALDSAFSSSFSTLDSLNAGLIIQAFDSALEISSSLLVHALGRLTLPTKDLFITTYRADALAKWSASIDRIRHLDETNDQGLVNEYTQRMRAEMRAQVRNKREQNRDRIIEQKTEDARREFRELEWTALKAAGLDPPGPPAAFVDKRTTLALYAGNVTEEIGGLATKLLRRFSDDLIAMEASASQGSDPSLPARSAAASASKKHQQPASAVSEDDEGLLTSDQASDLFVIFESVVDQLAGDMRRRMDALAEDRAYRERAQAARCLDFARAVAQRVEQASQVWSTPEGARWRFSPYVRSQVAIGSQESAIFCASNEDGTPAETTSAVAKQTAAEVASLFSSLESKLLLALALRADQARILIALVWLLSLWSLSTVFRILRRLRRGSKLNHDVLPLGAAGSRCAAAPWSIAAMVVHTMDAATWMLSLPMGAAAAVVVLYVPECTTAPIAVSLDSAAASSSSSASFSAASFFSQPLPSSAASLSSLAPSASVGSVLCLVGWLACVSVIGLWEFRTRRAQAQLNKMRASE